MSFLSGNGASGFSGVSVTVPASSGANQRMAIVSLTLECTTAPSGVTGTLGGRALRAGNVSINTIPSLEPVYSFYLNESDLAIIGTGAKSLTFSITGGTGNQGRQSQWAFFDGRSQSTPTFTANNGNAGGGGGSVGVTAAASGADIYAAAGSDSDTNTATAGYIPTYNATDGGGDANAIAMYQANVSAGSYTPGFTSVSGSAWAFFGVSLETASAGATITPTAGSDTIAGNAPTVTQATNTVVSPITARHQFETPNAPLRRAA